MMKEIILNDIPINYYVDDDGEILNGKTGDYLYGWIDVHGYRVVSLPKNPDDIIVKYKKKTVHRLVASAFVPNPNNLPQVNHIDGVKLHNWSGNLEWVTNKENYDHARSHGLIKTGGALSYATVDDKTVEKICELIGLGWRNVDIITTLGLPNDPHGKGLITRIRTGRSWKDISSKYDFIKTGSLKKVPDEVVHEICQCLEQRMSVSQIADTIGVVYGINYPRLKGLVFDIRTRRCHKGISNQYNF